MRIADISNTIIVCNDMRLIQTAGAQVQDMNVAIGAAECCSFVSVRGITLIMFAAHYDFEKRLVADVNPTFVFE